VNMSYFDVEIQWRKTCKIGRIETKKVWSRTFIGAQAKHSGMFFKWGETL